MICNKGCLRVRMKKLAQIGVITKLMVESKHYQAKLILWIMKSHKLVKKCLNIKNSKV